MQADDEQRQALRAHFKRIADSSRKAFRLAYAALNTALIVLIAWAIVTGVLYIAIDIYNVPIFGAPQHSQLLWNSFSAALAVHSVYLGVAVVGYILSISIVSNMSPASELRLAFPDVLLVNEYYRYIRKIVGNAVFNYAIIPNIVRFIIKFFIILTWCLNERQTSFISLLTIIELIAIEYLSIDVIVAITICLKDKIQQLIAWSAVAFITYLLWWCTWLAPRLASRYLDEFMYDVIFVCISILIVLVVIQSRRNVIAYTMQRARNMLADG